MVQIQASSGHLRRCEVWRRKKWWDFAFTNIPHCVRSTGAPGPCRQPSHSSGHTQAWRKETHTCTGRCMFLWVGWAVSSPLPIVSSPCSPLGSRPEEQLLSTDWPSLTSSKRQGKKAASERLGRTQRGGCGGWFRGSRVQRVIQRAVTLAHHYLNSSPSSTPCQLNRKCVDFFLHSVILICKVVLIISN